MSYQWVQVTCGLFYCGLTGRELEAIYSSDYRTMVTIGLGCVMLLTLGLAVGMGLLGAPSKERTEGAAAT